MGCVKTITHDTMPRQGSWLNKRVDVCFHFDTGHRLPGVIVRDDDEDPMVTIIRLDNGRLLLATECQYSLR